MYPKVIPLHKLKRDSKLVLDKEKNFKILLNAISQMDLPLTINVPISNSPRLLTSPMEKSLHFWSSCNGSSRNTIRSQINLLKAKEGQFKEE